MDEIKKIFEKYVSEEVLTEDVKNELSTVVEALVMEKAEEKFNIAREALIEEYDVKLQEAIEIATEEQHQNIDGYLTHCVNEFVEENRIKIENSIVVEKATKIIEGVQKVFEANGINLAESDENIVKTLNSKYDRVSESYNDSLHKLMKVEQEKLELEKAVRFLQETKDLTDIEQDRVMNLMSGLVVEDVEDFSTKLASVIRNVRFTKSNQSFVSEEIDEEDGSGDDVESKSVYRHLNKIRRN